MTITSDVNMGMPLCISNVDKSYTYLFNKNGLMKYIIGDIYRVSLFFIQMGKEPFRFVALAPNFYVCVTSDNKLNSISRPTETTGDETWSCAMYDTRCWHKRVPASLESSEFHSQKFETNFSTSINRIVIIIFFYFNRMSIYAFLSFYCTLNLGPNPDRELRFPYRLAIIITTTTEQPDERNATKTQREYIILGFYALI